MFNIKVYLIIALILFVLTSAILNSYQSYSMANSIDFEFASDTNTDPNYLVLKSADNRKNAVTASAFWSSNKYLIIAPPLLNIVAGVIGAYLLMF